MEAVVHVDASCGRLESQNPLLATGRPRLVKRPRILLAEDDTELRSLLAASLRKDGYEILEARDGAEVLGQLQPVLSRNRPWTASTPPPQPPDVIISDIRMPGLSGLEVLDAVRGARLATPVILITAFGAPETHARARRLGAAAVIDKPFDLADLRRLVQGLIAGNGGHCGERS